MKCKKSGCLYFDLKMTDNCSRFEPPNVLGCTARNTNKVFFDWQRQPPNENGYWWWWNEDGPPVPVNIEVSLTDGPRYFATVGQFGWNRAQWVEDMGGLWMRLMEPELPDSL